MPTAGDLELHRSNGRVCIPVYLRPGSSRDRIDGLHGKALKISLTSPAVKNRANQHLVGFLAELLRLPKGEVRIVRGLRSRLKTVAVERFNEQEVLDLLKPYLVG